MRHTFEVELKRSTHEGYMFYQPHSWRYNLSKAISIFAIKFCSNLMEIQVDSGIKDITIKGWRI